MAPARFFVGPANVKGIELNADASELGACRLIGEIQWMRRTGFGCGSPVLDPLETIECRDAFVGAGGGGRVA